MLKARPTGKTMNRRLLCAHRLHLVELGERQEEDGEKGERSGEDSDGLPHPHHCAATIRATNQDSFFRPTVAKAGCVL